VTNAGRIPLNCGKRREEKKKRDNGKNFFFSGWERGGKIRRRKDGVRGRSTLLHGKGGKKEGAVPHPSVSWETARRKEDRAGGGKGCSVDAQSVFAKKQVDALSYSRASREERSRGKSLLMTFATEGRGGEKRKKHNGMIMQRERYKKTGSQSLEKEK